MEKSERVSEGGDRKRWGNLQGEREKCYRTGKCIRENAAPAARRTKERHLYRSLEAIEWGKILTTATLPPQRHSSGGWTTERTRTPFSGAVYSFRVRYQGGTEGGRFESAPVIVVICKEQRAAEELSVTLQ